ncbi:MAG: hypothetical protein EBS05_21755 [Proteobacteria bacterium]|nr:hypothetical protein [Pseudomonadota bacterium]
MQLLTTNRFTRALTLTEVLVVVVALLFLAAVLLTFTTSAKVHVIRFKCQNNLKQTGLSFKVWANDNDDKSPFLTTNCLAYTNETQAWLHYFAMSNEIGSARILTCPQDASRLPNMVMDFTSGPTGLLSKTNRAVSCFVGLTWDEILPNTLMTGDRNILAAPEATNSCVLPLATNTSFRWGSDLHTNRGNVTLADGAVHSFDRWGLQSHLSNGVSRLGTLVGSGLATNRLLMPVVHP